MIVTESINYKYGANGQKIYFWCESWPKCVGFWQERAEQQMHFWRERVKQKEFFWREGTELTV